MQNIGRGRARRRPFVMQAVSKRAFHRSRKLPRGKGFDQHVVRAAPNGFGPQRGIAYRRDENDAGSQLLLDHPAKNPAPVAIGKGDINNDNFDGGMLTKNRTGLAASGGRQNFQPKPFSAFRQGISTFTNGRYE